MNEIYTIKVATSAPTMNTILIIISFSFLSFTVGGFEKTFWDGILSENDLNGDLIKRYRIKQESSIPFMQV